MHKAPACAGSREGSNHIESYVRWPFLAFLQEAISRTWTHDLMVTRQQFTTAPGLPFIQIMFHSSKLKQNKQDACGISMAEQSFWQERLAADKHEMPNKRERILNWFYSDGVEITRWVEVCQLKCVRSLTVY
jgi:hypothetical protein